MKSVLISIKPKWCELIASGEKIAEIRKSKPKIYEPFKCYIYETKGIYKPKGSNHFFQGQGKVVGEFVCGGIKPLMNIAVDNWEHLKGSSFDFEKHIVTDCALLTEEELHQYANGKSCYAWQIEKLVIYEKPKELSEFRSYNVRTYLENGYPMPTHEMKRPPQSWCYVEELTAY
jgi:predicted transcriptional regulator